MPKILICGDYCPIGEIEKLSLRKEHESIFNGFLDYMKGIDFSICNLECPVTEKSSPALKYGPVLKAHPETLESLKYAGFDLVTLANNHIMDHGTVGLNSTMEACKKYDLEYVGAGNNLEEARQPFVKSIEGKKIAILNIAENEYSNTHGNRPGANPLSFPKNLQDIVKAKKECDFLILIFHGGNEMYQLPSPRLKETLRFMVDAGADAVIGHHTHCFSGYEWYNGKPIFYSIGNFVFDYNLREDKLWNNSYAVILEVAEKEVSFKIIPYFQNKNVAGLKMMDKDEEQIVLDKVKELNCIIENDTLLENAFEDFIASKEKQYKHFLEPYTNRYLHGLYGRKFLPSMLNNKKKMLYLNLFRCEAHRDIMFRLLSQ